MAGRRAFTAAFTTRSAATRRFQRIDAPNCERPLGPEGEKALHFCATDNWGYHGDLTINAGVVSGTANTGACGISTVSGRPPTHLRADIQVPTVGCVSFDYYVEVADRINRTASGSWPNDAGATGTWSATGGRCQ